MEIDVIKVAGIEFSHLHMGDNLRMVFEHPEAEICGICHSEKSLMGQAVQNFKIPENKIFTDWEECMKQTQPDIVILCPPTAEHTLWVERIAAYDVHIILEKPFASTLEEADRIINILKGRNKLFAVNWPLAWYPPHVKAKELLDQGLIGDIREVHFYDGNRGPLWHLADKVETSAEEVERGKTKSWFYKKEFGGGSLLDYLGYGTTLGAWYHGGAKPLEVSSSTFQTEGLEVDEHSITTARFEYGLSKFETRWGTFTDPWVYQPQPKCGFYLVGTEGTISSFDFEKTVRVQTRTHPEGIEYSADSLKAPFHNPVAYMIHCIQNSLSIEGPLSIEMARIGQQIVDTAFISAKSKRTMDLIG
ncbi:Gfo/Idh/MocA family oxidoreductase [Oceanispirochaeta sp. M2]|nr:Gfo/Idh/MocA family oxidoreductase [Oceanispirochaeta sp. M2]NPD74020.1 Gfo/Idh/MocA family oxidoreductase [Oceanispirochaeta sp. M1]RDG30215.1 gfo/Idh/MocA family oxidoreductase [Oceanispirochaeta sp. M1]